MQSKDIVVQSHGYDGLIEENKEKSQTITTTKIDDSKVSILYAQMHYIVLKNEPLDNITFNFYDVNEEALGHLKNFFSKNDALIPNNVTLNLHYSSLSQDTKIFASIRGQGQLDSQYIQTVQDMEAIADPENTQKNINIAAKVTLKELNFKNDAREIQQVQIYSQYSHQSSIKTSDHEVIEDENDLSLEKANKPSGMSRLLMSFLKFMHHPATKIILLILLVAALTILTYGLVGIGTAAAASAVIGTAAIASTAAGGGTALISSIGLGLAFFSPKKTDQKDIFTAPESTM